MCDHDGMCLCSDITTTTPNPFETQSRDIKRFVRFLNPDVYNWFIYIACKAAVVNYNDAMGHLFAFEALFAKKDLTDEQFELLEKLHENCHLSEDQLMTYLQRFGFTF